MNKIYKVIWNRVRHCYVVVSEIAKNHGKEHSTNLRVSKGLCALTLAIGLSLSSYAFAAGTSVPFGDKDDKGNILASADYDTRGNLTIGNKGTVAQGEKKAGKNNTTIGTDSDTLRNVKEGDTSKNGQPMDEANTKLVDGEGTAHKLDTSTESGGSTAVGFNNKAEGDNSTAIGNMAKIINKPVTYYADKDGNKTTSADNAAWYKDSSGNPTQVPQVFRDADGNTTTTPQYVHTYTVKNPDTGEEVTKTEITSDASKADQKDGKPVYSYQKTDNRDKLYSVTLYQAASNSIAAGSNVTANGNNAVAVGYNSTADTSAVAVGDTATASGDNTIAIGTEAKATDTSNNKYGSIAIGKGIEANGSSTAVGLNGTKATYDSSAYGNNAVAQNSSSAFGSSVQASNGSYASGMGGTTASNGSMAVGNGVHAGSSGGSAFAIGMGGTTADSGSMSVGNNVHAGSSSGRAVAVGMGGTTADGSAIAVGDGVHASYSAFASGRNGTTATNGGIAYGDNVSAQYGGFAAGTNQTSAVSGVAVGSNVHAYDGSSYAGGMNGTTAESGSIAFGNNVHADSGSYAAGMGGTHATGSAVAIGNNAYAYGGSYAFGSAHAESGSTAIGSGATAKYGSYAFGSSADAESSSTAIGSGATAKYGSYAFGSSADAENSSYAIGDSSYAANSSLALGNSAGAYVSGGIALGSNSTVYRGATAGLDPRNGQTSKNTTPTWKSTYGALSIGAVDSSGNVTGTRQIIGVAAGTNDTDAVNVAQLKAATQKVNMHDYSVLSPDTETDTNYTNGGALAKNSLAAGVSASTTKEAENAVAIGYKAKAEGVGATVIGQYGTATGQYATAFGGINTDSTGTPVNNTASGANSLAFGERTAASGNNSTAFGWQTKATEKRTTAFGERTTASGANSTAFGQLAVASGQNSTAFGNEAVANNYGSTAFGNRTEALGEYSTTFGNSTVAAGMNTVAFGTDNVAGAVLDGNGAYTNIIYKTNAKGRVERDANGNPIELSREKMDARGNLAYTDSNGNTKSVTYTVSGGETHSYVLLQGEDSNTYIRDYRGNIRSAAIGSDGTVTVGDTALTDVTLKKATAGANGYHILSNANATVWGENSIASGEASTAFGIGSNASGKNSVAIGGATASLDDSIALGKGSVTTRAKYSELTKDAEKAAYGKGSSTGSAWEATDNAIAIGNDSTTTRQITGVAAGSLDTDAVNVAQLRAVDERHTTVSVGGQKATADNTVVKGGNLELKRTKTNGQYNYDVSLNKDITLGTQEEENGGSLTINTLGTFHEKDEQGHQKDVPIKEAVKIDGSTISIVKHDGTDGTNDQRQVVLGVGPDAGGYVVLYDKTGKKPTYIYNSITPGATYLQDGNSYTADKANEYGRLEYGDYYNGSIQFIATLDDGQKYAGDNYKAAETETKTVDGKTTTTVTKEEQNVLLKKLNERLDIKGGAKGALTENNIGVNVKDGVMKVQLAQNLDLGDNGSVKMGNTTINNGGVTITPTGVTEDKEKISLTDKGLSNGGKQITHVDSGLKDADGNKVELKDATGDVLNNAVNVGDLQKVQNAVTSAHTAVTVNGSVGAPEVEANGKLGAYTDKEKGNLLLAQKKDTTTGQITYDLKLNDNVILGKDGSDGTDGQEGTIGLTGKDGLPGTDGKQGYSTTIIKTEKGQAGKDGKNLGGTDITRIVYTDKDGSNPQTVATLSDGLKFAGDDMSKTVDKKLNETLQIRGDGTYDKTTQKTKEDGNIQVSADTDTGTIKVALNKDINLEQNGSLTVGGDTQDGSTKDPIVIKHFDAGKLTVTGTDKNGNTPQSKAGDYATGLDNKDWDVDHPTYVSGRAATEDQLKAISDTIKSNAQTVAGQHTAVTVNDKDNETTAPVGTDGKYSSNYGSYSDSSKGNLLIAAKTKDGQTTYNIKLNDQLAIGQKGEQGVAGKDGQDGKVAVDTKGGTTVVIGHDGEPGKDGKDGISVKGQDGKDGVTISVTNGKDGKDGSEGHIGLTGPKGADGKDGQNASADIHVKNGQVGVDGTDGNKGTNGMDRVVYEDHNHVTHEVATMDDGLKIGANAASKEKAANPVSNKLNSTINIMGSAAKTGHTYTDDNLTTTVEQDKDGNTTVKVLMDKDITGNSVTVGEKGESGTPGKDGVDGTIGVNGKDGSSVVIKGTDGISINGKDGQNGVTIKGVDGKAGTEGHIGLTGPKGPKGADGKDGQNASADIHVVNGHVGVDGTDGHDGKDDMDRVVYEDHNHITHEVATMDDGLKFAGDDVNTTVAKKLNDTLQIRGDGTYDATTKKSDGNIQTSVDNGTIKVALNDKINLHQDGSLTVGGDKKDSSTTVDDPIVIKHFDDKTLDVITGVDKEGKPITAKEGKVGDYVTGLDNKDWNVDKPEYVSGRAATEDQLKKVSDAVNKTSAQHTVVTVNDNKDGHDTKAVAVKGAFGQYAGIDKDNLLIAAKDEDGKTTYNIKLNDQLTIGQKGEPGVAGKDGKDGKVTVETKGGTTVVIGHDGKDGENGKDGISVIGKDGQNGVSIAGSNGFNGKDGIDGKIVIGTPGKDGQPGKDVVSITGKDGVGHIGLTGPKGEKGADGTPGKDGISIDITTDLKSATLDDGKNVKTVIKDKDGKETTITQAPRIQYDSNGKSYEVATMDDGMKYAGDFGKGASVKLNKTVNVKGNAKKEADLTDGNIGVVSSQRGDDGQLLIKLNKDLNLGNNGSVKMGNTTINNDGMTISKTEPGKTTTVTLTDKGLDNGGNKITNVADGEISATSKDAVNGSQLNAVKTLAGQHTTVEAGPSGNVTVTSGTNIDGSKKYTVDLAKDVTFGDAAKGDNTVAISGTDGKITASTGDNKVTVDGSKGQIVAGDDNNGVKIGKIADGDSSLTIYDKDGNATNKKADGGKYVTNLDNKTWNEDGSYVSGRAATEDQLHQLESSFNTKVDAVEQNHTAVTVNGSVEAPDAGANGTLGNYTDEKKGNLLLAQKKDSTGKITYDLKLNDKVTLGKAGTNGKDGVDGSIGLTGADGKSSIGLNGKDGISVIGADGKNGVSITGSNGKDGKDGIDGKITIGTPGKDGQPGKDAISISGQNGEGHIGLTGAAGKDGKNATADIHVKNGQVGVDGTDGHGGKDGMDRVVYEDHNGTPHEVATMDDGMKYGDDFGNTAKVKLNHQLDIVGDINAGKKDGDKKATKDDLSDGNIGIIATDTTYNDDGTVKENGKMTVKLAKDLKGLNSIESNSVTTGNTTINNGGLTIKTGDENRNITVQDGNVNMGGNQIHNVAPGQAPGDAVNVSQLNATNSAVNKLGSRVNRVGAGAAALAALHPLDFDPDDKWDFAAGYGNYKDASAVAVGAYYRPNEDTMFSVGGSFGGGENMVNAGVSFKVGQGNHVSTSRVAMAKEIKDLRQDVANLNAIVNRQSALIDKLTGTNAGTIQDAGNDLFPDVPANHWAYEYVTKLKQAGILTGYPDGNFDGDRMMTRYEFAAIVYRAIMAGAASNPALSQDGTLDKLAKEFSPEMKHIRIDTIAKDKNGKPTIERVRVIPEAKQ